MHLPDLLGTTSANDFADNLHGSPVDRSAGRLPCPDWLAPAPRNVARGWVRHPKGHIVGDARVRLWDWVC
jgi:hypothetical protein